MNDLPASDGKLSGTRRRVVQSMVLAIPVAILVIGGWTRRWLTDDGFIYLRVVSQISVGNGPVFNAGERVETYTSPLWLAMLSAADLLMPLRLEWIAVVLGLVLSVLGLLGAMSGAAQLAIRADDDERTGLLVPVGALVVVAPFFTWVWVTAGMETSLVWAWLGVMAHLMGRWASTTSKATLWTVAVAGLGWLIRPELLLVSGLFVLAMLIGDRHQSSWPHRAKVVGVAVALPVMYQIFRMGYFGLAVANTALVKEGTSIRWDRGFEYLRDVVDPYSLWFPIAVLVIAAYVPLLAAADSRRRLVIAAFGLGGVGSAFYVVAVGGDYLHGRLFVPAFFAFCAPVAVLPLRRRYLASLAVVPWVLAAVVLVRPPQLDGGLLSTFTVLPDSAGMVTTDDLGWGSGGTAIAWFGDEDLYVEQKAFVSNGFVPAAFAANDRLSVPAVTSSGIGVVSYALGPEVNIVDVLGLAHPINSHFRIDPDAKSYAGHEKQAPAPWLLAEVAAPGESVAPDSLGIVRGGMIPDTTGEEFQAQVADARAARQCETIQRLQDAVSGHLGPRRFIKNFMEAPANTLVRISPDPADARAELC